MKSNDSFEFTYSASEREEVRQIREKYMPQEVRESKMDQLRRLDASVGRKASVWSIVLGVLSSLVMGIGMCCCMVWADKMFIPGIFIGVLGMVGVGLAYPLHTHIIKKERERIAPQILQLTDELMQ